MDCWRSFTVGHLFSKTYFFLNLKSSCNRDVGLGEIPFFCVKKTISGRNYLPLLYKRLMNELFCYEPVQPTDQYAQCFSHPAKEIQHFHPPIMGHNAWVWYWECRKTIGKKIGLKSFLKNPFFGGLKVIVFQKLENFYMYLCNIITWLLSIKNTKIWGVLKSTFHDLHFETL